jgi:peptide/nickel transport system ATP-binding protein
MDPLLQVRELCVSFKAGRAQRATGTGDVLAVDKVSFDVPRNTTVALVGESGSGKSVSSLAIMGLLPSGVAHIGAGSSIVFNGADLLQQTQAARRDMAGRDIAMIFQEPMSSLNPVFSVGFQIAEVLRLHLKLDARAARQRTLALLAEVGLPDPAHAINAYPSELSGGQQQRVMIAMAIACEPQLLIADEPTTALDVTVQRQIMTLLAQLQRKRHMAMLFITHDLALVADIADRVVVMRHGQVREEGAAAQVLGSPRDPYTQALLHCRPRLDARPLRLPVIDDYLQGRAGPGIVLPERLRAPLPAAAASGNDAVLVVHKLCKSFYLRQGWFGQREVKAVRDVSFVLPRGQTLGVVGESGSGKSTMGLTLLRLHQATSGSVLFDGRDVLAMDKRSFQPYKRRLQIIFQNPYASLNPRFTVGQILREPMHIHGIGATAHERDALAAALLDRVGLPQAASQRYPHEFSGGQRQRIAIARCLTMQPEVLICDESVSALDVSVQAQVLNLLQDLQDEFKLSYLFISHDLAVVRHMADQVMVMQQGSVVELADADTLYRAPQHPYTRALLAAVPGQGRQDPATAPPEFR